MVLNLNVWQIDIDEIKQFCVLITYIQTSDHIQQIKSSYAPERGIYKIDSSVGLKEVDGGAPGKVDGVDGLHGHEDQHPGPLGEGDGLEEEKRTCNGVLGKGTISTRRGRPRW